MKKITSLGFMLIASALIPSSLWAQGAATDGDGALLEKLDEFAQNSPAAPVLPPAAPALPEPPVAASGLPSPPALPAAPAAPSLNEAAAEKKAPEPVAVKEAAPAEPAPALPRFDEIVKADGSKPEEKQTEIKSVLSEEEKKEAEKNNAKDDTQNNGELNLSDLLKPSEDAAATDEGTEKKKTKAAKKKSAGYGSLKNVTFKKYRLPETIYARSYSDRDNGHLPVARYEADYDAMLFGATERNDINALRALVEYSKRNIEMRNSEGETPLIFAARTGALTSLRYFIAKKADLNAMSDNGVSALHHATHAENPAMVQALLTKGANPNVLDGNGRTPLMEAAQNGNPAIVAELLSHGADPNVVAANGATALSLAGGDAASTELLTQYGAVDSTPEQVTEIPAEVPADFVQSTPPAPPATDNVIYYDADGNEIKM